jgi:hypothetical protein
LGNSELGCHGPVAEASAPVVAVKEIIESDAGRDRNIFYPDQKNS